ncbi:MAG: hypothetical protein AB7T20_03775 [Steroidobacteraceae bacterium]
MSNPHRNPFAARVRPGPARRAGWIAAAIGVLATAVAGAQVPLKTVEECLETGTDLVALPGAAGGTLSATQCRGCETLRLKFDARTRYYIGKELVPYARLREAAGKDTVRLYVFYRPDTRTLTRLRLVAVGNAK